MLRCVNCVGVSATQVVFTDVGLRLLQEDLIVNDSFHVWHVSFRELLKHSLWHFSTKFELSHAWKARLIANLSKFCSLHALSIESAVGFVLIVEFLVDVW